jgi:hypothetical protein
MTRDHKTVVAFGYTPEDLEVARRWLDVNSSRSSGRGKRLAELIAEVRAEAQVALAKELSSLPMDEIFRTLARFGAFSDP